MCWKKSRCLTSEVSTEISSFNNRLISCTCPFAQASSSAVMASSVLLHRTFRIAFFRLRRILLISSFPMLLDAAFAVAGSPSDVAAWLECIEDASPTLDLLLAVLSALLPVSLAVVDLTERRFFFLVCCRVFSACDPRTHTEKNKCNYNI